MVKQFVPPKLDEERRVAKVLALLDPLPEGRNEAEYAIEGAFAQLIAEAMELEAKKAATSGDISGAAEKISELLKKLQPLLDDFSGLGPFWMADVRLPSSQDVDGWLKELGKIENKVFTSKSDASLVKLAARRARALAPMSRRKLTKKQIAEIGAALLGDETSSGAVLSYLKGKKPI